ncbi:MAG TPA: FAD-dependent oxidoreductase [Geminicoccaceae bacterium]|nr:FAD-dependent oxidoreductase [Geminicoccaceae bacterium]
MTSYDAVVIGGGVVGASTAYHLVRAGVRTLLVDRRDAGQATDAGAGILSTAANTEDPDPIERFEARATAYYPVLVEHLRGDGAGDTGYGVCGSLTVAVDDDEVAHFHQVRTGLRRWRAAKDHGYAEIGPDEAKALFPPLANVQGAIHCGRGARVDGRLLGAALLRAAGQRGLEVAHAAVEELVIENGAVSGIRVAGERIACGYVVIAAGGWSKELGRSLDVDIPVEPQRGQIVHLGLPGVDTSAWPIVLAFRGHYMVPWDDSRVVVGATRETGSGFLPHTTAAGVIQVLAEALRVAPGLAEATIREIRVGLRPASRDGLPILGPVAGFERLLLATGHGSIGLQLGPYSGKVVAGMIARGEAETDIGPFRLARFRRVR